MPKSKDRGTGTQMKTLKFLDKHLEEFIMVLLLSSIVVIMLFQIIRRYIFNDSLSWSEEFCRYCFIWMMFVAFSYSARLGSDLRVDALIGMLPQGCRNIIEIINLILCIMVAGFLFYHSFGTVAGVMETGEASVALKLPMQYVYAASVVGYGLGTVRYIQRLVLFILGLKNPLLRRVWHDLSCCRCFCCRHPDGIPSGFDPHRCHCGPRTH